ncbi:anthocyanidin 3-O-glucosyltransferase 5-like [Trifolium pratense]|uniref:anthocyanidin 3-O-glucosyltransferase 5-like n=1 Tax=Trifolium pratense TaxID=57577 RepID=UPI001E6976EB|nr:anthocyanidin 3-O-glucosyltransferase 5-like [Trifolium pratense]
MDLQKTAHVVLLSSPGIGHLIPIIELGKRFHIHHNFKVTILVITSQTSQAESQILKSATNPSLYTIIPIPSSNISATAVSTRIRLTMRHSIPSIKSALINLPLRPSAFIVDIFGTESLILAKELNIPKFVYVASHAWYLSLFAYSPVLDKQIEGQYVDQKEPLKIPGCKSVRPEDLVDSMMDRNNLQYKEYLITANNLCKSDAVLVNTWNELQHRELKALNGELSCLLKIPVFAVGPIVRQTKSKTDQHTESMMRWLDKQPKESVVYVSFGSGGTLSYDQMKELAFGLELSEQRFIWVLRAPRGDDADGAFFTTGCSDRFDEIQKQLPDGFLERIKNLGMLVQEWAPQVNVLKHGSIGCFISHCGWGSVLESLTNGVPIIAWPLYAEQRMNATMLVEELGVAVKTTLSPTKNVVGREEIASLVKKVILVERNGKSNRMTERVREIKVSAEKALCEGGSSYNTLSKVAKIINKQDFISLSLNVDMRDEIKD